MRKLEMLIALTTLTAGVAACGHETRVVRRETVTQTAPVVQRETVIVPAEPVVTERRTIIQTEPAQPERRVYEERKTTIEEE